MTVTHKPASRGQGGRSRWTGDTWPGALLLLLLGLPAASQGQDATEQVFWQELANQAGCYVWNGDLQKDKSVTWTGECSGSLAHGAGSLTWVSGEDKQVSTSTGFLQDGKRHGPWVVREADGIVGEGPYVNGKMHGSWVVRLANGTVEEGPIVNGKRHGLWVGRLANGNVGEGPYVNGEPHGPWVFRNADGTVEEGPYVNGKRHGPWVGRYANGTVEEGPYVNDERHGPWVVRKADGTGRVVTFVNGERQ